VQKAIMLTGHIVDGLTTQVAPHVWNKLTPDEQKIFTEVTREAAARATAQIKKREAELPPSSRRRACRSSKSTEELHRRGPQVDDAGVAGIHQGGLRQDRRHQVVARPTRPVGHPLPACGRGPG
jgi:hypothetical protein